MEDKLNHVMTEYKDKALNTEMIEDTSSLDVLNKVLKASEDELKQLVNIEKNTYLANQKKQELMNLNDQNYIDDITYQNYIIISHNSSIQYAMQRGIQFWKSYDNSSIFYRVNAFSKQKKLDAERDLFSLLGTHIKIYDSIEKVQFTNNTLILIANYLSIVKDDIFDPNNSLEWLIFNNMKYKNTFQYTSFLQRKNMLAEKMHLEQLVQSRYHQVTLPLINIPPIAPQTIQLLHPVESAQDVFIFSPITPPNKLQELSQQLKIQPSTIQNFIYHMTKNKDDFEYLMNWLANFFQTLNKSAMAIVLIGDNETTDILINNIIKPIFANKKEYLSVINDETFKKSSDTIIKDKIFYHIDTDNLSDENIKKSTLSKLVKILVKPNSLNSLQAIENNEIYVHGETIVTSNAKSPYPFLKNNYSRCSVFKVRDINNILKKINIDQLELEEYIQNDLHNFSSILAQYQTDKKYMIIAETDEKKVLPEIKKGVLMTSDLEKKIQAFIDAIKYKRKNYFYDLSLEENEELYRELIDNFVKDDAIYQPLLAEYFNIINKDIIFSDNSYFIELLKERACLFNQKADDNFKLNGQRRYKINEYELGKNYKGNCMDPSQIDEMTQVKY